MTAVRYARLEGYSILHSSPHFDNSTRFIVIFYHQVLQSPNLTLFLLFHQNHQSLMKNLFVFMFTIFSAYVMTSCVNLETEEQKERKEERRKENVQDEIEEDLAAAKDDISNAFDNLGDALEGLKKKHNIDDKAPVSFRDMKKALPKSLAGVDFEESEGQTTGILGIKISTVEATYQEDDSAFEVTIVDVAGVGQLVKKMANWSEFEVDKETKNGYERTTEIDGHPALEKYNERREEGEISLLVDDRFIITIKGEGVSERQMRRAVDDVDIRKLVRLGE